MNFQATGKSLTIAALALGIAAGCASTAGQKGPEAVDNGAAEQTGVSKAAAERAIAVAKSMNDRAASMGYEWTTTGDIIKQAEMALGEKEYAKAQELARKAREQAADAINQKKLEDARLTYLELKDIQGLDAEQKARLNELLELIKSGDGAAANEYAQELAAELAALQDASMVYEVVRGDSLWGISGKDEIYGNPYQWPLIYKNNSDRIEDADLIYPGQSLDIETNPGAAAVESAVEHAKTRGAWSLGNVEASDKAYLRQ